METTCYNMVINDLRLNSDTKQIIIIQFVHDVVAFSSTTNKMQHFQYAAVSLKLFKLLPISREEKMLFLRNEKIPPLEECKSPQSSHGKSTMLPESDTHQVVYFSMFWCCT